MTLLEEALSYAAHGWAVFPCHWPVVKDGLTLCSCGLPPGKGKGFCSSLGKHPRTAHSFYDATRDERSINEWWGRAPYANIGLATGEINNILVLDVDPPHGGDTSLLQLEAAHGPLPNTLRANTGSGGQHIIFQHVEGLSNCVGAIGGGLDIRTQGGYIVVAPSLHASGRRYEWANDTPICSAPSWLIEEIKKTGGAAPTPEEGTRIQYDYWSRIANGVKEGERHVMILKLAGLLVGARRLPAILSLSLLRAYNKEYCRPPLPDNEVDARFSRVVKRQVAREKKHGG